MDQRTSILCAVPMPDPTDQQTISRTVSSNTCINVNACHTVQDYRFRVRGGCSDLTWPKQCMRASRAEKVDVSITPESTANLDATICSGGAVFAGKCVESIVCSVCFASLVELVD
jgi:hypothetical protein